MNDEMNDDGYAQAINEKAAKADIAAGARALRELQKTAGRNWTNGWSAVVRGWRGLRDLAFKRAGVQDTASQAYRTAMSDLLALAQNIEYRSIPKETRAAMTRLIGHIDEIDAWYATLSVWDRERWTNPQTIVKHAPAHLLVGRSHNRPKRAKGPKNRGNPEAESLRAILIRVVTKYVMPVDPEEAKALLESLYASDPDDGLDDLGLDDAESADE
jgi:hypothetical protein